MTLKTFYPFLTILVILFLNKIISKSENQEVHEAQYEQRSPDTYDLTLPKNGKVQELTTKMYSNLIPLEFINGDSKYGYGIPDPYNQAFALAKPSTSNKMYFVNGYLTGFVPFEPQNMWLPLNYLQTRLKYQYDEVDSKSREEVWQTSKESYIKLHGDCEDHAILLADWFIGLGYDARVVTGMVKQRGDAPEGHAWVVLFYDGKEYLLEATKKSKWNRIPLAKTQNNYFPKYMFNRTDFWVNTGKVFTTKYSGSKWKKNGRFIPDNPYYKDLD